MNTSGQNQINLSNNENWDSEPQFSTSGDILFFLVTETVIPKYTL